MPKRRDGTMQDEYINRMVKNLPVLRAAANLTQEQLGTKLGVSRQTIVAIENEKSSLTWSLYLAMVLVFATNAKTSELLVTLDVFDKELLS